MSTGKRLANSVFSQRMPSLEACSLDHLFLHLVNITTSPSDGSSSDSLARPWNWVWELVKNCQAVKEDERIRGEALEIGLIVDSPTI